MTAPQSSSGAASDPSAHLLGLLQELDVLCHRADFDAAREIGATLRDEATRSGPDGRQPAPGSASLALLRTGLAELLGGESEQAQRDFEAAWMLRAPGSADATGYEALLSLAVVQAAAGRLRAAERTLRRSGSLPAPDPSARRHTGSTARLVRTLIAVERMEPDADAQASAALEDFVDDELWVVAFVAATRQAAACGDHTHLLDLVHEATVRRPLPPASLAALEVRGAHARALLMLGDHVGAAEVLVTCDPADRGLAALAPNRVRLALEIDGPAAALELAREVVLLPGLGPSARAETMLLMMLAQQREDGTADPVIAGSLGALLVREGLWRPLQLVPPEVAAAVPSVEAAPEIVRDRVVRQRSTEWPLTPTELEVLRLLATPQSLSSIAQARFVSPNTVKSQVAAVYRRLGVHRREDAVAEAGRRGLLG